MSVLDDIAAVLNSPEAKQGMRAFSRIGMPLELVQHDKENFIKQQQIDMVQQQEMQKQQQQAMASQMLASIMSDGKPDSEKLSVLAQFDPDMAMELYQMAQKEQRQTLQPVTLPDGTVLGYDKYTNTVTPTNMAGQGAPTSDSAYSTVSEAPASDMAGLSPVGRVVAEKAQIAADAPLTRYQQEQLEQQRLQNELNEQKLAADKEKEQKKLQENKIAGLDFAEGYMPSTDDAKSVKQLTLYNKNLKSGVAQLKELTQKTAGIPILSPKTKSDIQNVLSNIQLNAKGLFELGALQAPDIELINRMLVDPSSWGSTLMSTDAIINSLDNFQQTLDSQYKNAVETRGYKINEPKAQNQAIPEDVTPDLWEAMTPEERALWQR